eukprot:12381135-Heterocapsa_arctica.AAC.1
MAGVDVQQDDFEMGGFEWQAAGDEFMQQDDLEMASLDVQQDDLERAGLEVSGSSAQERLAAMRTRIILRELASIPPEPTTKQATRKRVLEFELDVLGARAVRPRVEGPQPRPPGFIRQDFVPEPPGRVIGRPDAAGHALFCTGNLVWCSLCGAYTQSRLFKLADTCPGGASGANA